MNDAAVTKHKDMSEPMLGTLLLLPAALLLLLIVVYPIATLFWTSLHAVDQANPQAGEQWIGLGNYLRAFNDARFWHSALQTVIYIVVTVPGALVVGLGLALLANQPFKVQWPVRLALLLPWALPLVFAGLIFRWFFDTRRESSTTCWCAWASSRSAGCRTRRWRRSPSASRSSGSASSFMALMLLAGLQTIPKSLYEAAEVDGATKWQQFVEITLPMLRPAIFVALIFRTITAIQTFDIPYAMTGGGPGDSTETLAMYIHKTTLDFLDFGYGSALAALMFVLSMVATSGYLRYTRRSSGRGAEE